MDVYNIINCQTYRDSIKVVDRQSDARKRRNACYLARTFTLSLALHSLALHSLALYSLARSCLARTFILSLPLFTLSLAYVDQRLLASKIADGPQRNAGDDQDDVS